MPDSPESLRDRIAQCERENQSLLSQLDEAKREREGADVRLRLANWVMSMLWQSIGGWMNRPDYFDTNDLKLLGDLAYLAQTQPDDLAGSLGAFHPMDAYDLVCGMQRKEGSPLLRWLETRDKDETKPPLMCDVAKYTKWGWKGEEEERIND